MNNQIILIILILLSGCSKNRKTDTSKQLTNADSLTITTLGQQEQATWEFFQQLEAAMKDDNEIKEESIDEYIQALIDEGSAPQPEIFIDTETGTESRIVDYQTYKKFREENPINLERPYVISIPTVDTLPRDSLRKNLIKALKVDSVK